MTFDEALKLMKAGYNTEQIIAINNALNGTAPAVAPTVAPVATTAVAPEATTAVAPTVAPVATTAVAPEATTAVAPATPTVASITAPDLNKIFTELTGIRQAIQNNNITDNSINTPSNTLDASLKRILEGE